MSNDSKKKMQFALMLVLFLAVAGISTWKLGVGITLLILGTALIVFLNWPRKDPKKKTLTFVLLALFIAAVGISTWKLGAGKTLLLFGIVLVLLIAIAILASGKKTGQKNRISWDDYDRIVCPKCGQTLGSRMEMRRSLGSFKPTASVGGTTRCRYCNAEFYLSL